MSNKTKKQLSVLAVLSLFILIVYAAQTGLEKASQTAAPFYDMFGDSYSSETARNDTDTKLLKQAGDIGGSKLKMSGCKETSGSALGATVNHEQCKPQGSGKCIDPNCAKKGTCHLRDKCGCVGTAPGGYLVTGMCVSGCCEGLKWPDATSATGGGGGILGNVLGQALGKVLEKLMGGGESGGGSGGGSGSYNDLWGSNRYDNNPPTYVCSDGTQVLDAAFCPNGLGVHTCADGTKVTDAAFCADSTDSTDTDTDITDTTDSDSDGIIDNLDNCPYVANSDQADADADGIGTMCDTDETGTDAGTNIDTDTDTQTSTDTDTNTNNTNTTYGATAPTTGGQSGSGGDNNAHTTTYVRLDAVARTPIVGGNIVRTPTLDTYNQAQREAYGIGTDEEIGGLSRSDLEWQGLEELARRQLEGGDKGADYPYGALSEEELKALRDYHRSAIAVSGDLNPFSGNPLAGDRYRWEEESDEKQPGWATQLLLSLLALFKGMVGAQ